MFNYHYSKYMCGNEFCNPCMEFFFKKSNCSDQLVLLVGLYSLFQSVYEMKTTNHRFGTQPEKMKNWSMSNM